MATVALEAKERLGSIKQIVGDGTMGTVTFRAVVHEVRVFIRKRPLLIGVALDAYVMDRILSQVMIGKTAVRVMAVCAGDLAFGNRVMARKGKFSLDLMMTPPAHGKGLWRAYDKVRPDMDAVTVRAGNIIHRVRTCVPVMEVEGCVRRVALEADEGKRRRRQGLEIDECFVAAFGLDALLPVGIHFFGSEALDRDAPGTVAGFTVDKGHTGCARHLGAHGTGFEIATDLVVVVAGTEAVLRANVVRIYAADDQPFIFLDRYDRS